MGGGYLAKNRGKVSGDSLRVFLGLSLSSRPRQPDRRGGSSAEMNTEALTDLIQHSLC